MLDLDAYFRRIGYTGARAPTLATLLGIETPSGATGHPLAEILTPAASRP